jgi:hypothetical protein
LSEQHKSLSERERLFSQDDLDLKTTRFLEQLGSGSGIGMSKLQESFESTRATPDLGHAILYLNAMRLIASSLPPANITEAIGFVNQIKQYLKDSSFRYGDAYEGACIKQWERFCDTRLTEKNFLSAFEKAVAPKAPSMLSRVTSLFRKGPGSDPGAGPAVETQL